MESSCILVVAYLGRPEVLNMKLIDENIRFDKTLYSLRKIVKEINNKTSVYVSLTGDLKQSKLLESYFDNISNIFFFYSIQNESDISKGNGYLENSSIVKSINYFELDKKYKYIIKVTGKYYPSNIIDVMNYTKEISHSGYQSVAWKNFRKNQVDTRVFIFNPLFYLNSQVYLKKIRNDKGLWMEIIVYNLLLSNNQLILTFNKRPIINGYSGSTNKKIRMNPFKIFLIKLFSILPGEF